MMGTDRPEESYLAKGARGWSLAADPDSPRYLEGRQPVAGLGMEHRSYSSPIYRRD